MISVVIPVKDGGEILVRCLEAIASQDVAEEVEVIVVDSGSRDGSPRRARERGATVLEIPPHEFVHGGTRNRAIAEARGDLLVFISQDAVPVSSEWLAVLSAAAKSGDRVAGAYGRQTPHENARPPERFFLDFLYGSEPRCQALEPGEEPTFEVTLFSNVNSAIRRSVLARYPFADDVSMSEDQEWSRRVLLDGLELRYEPRAVVQHSHAYTIRSAFRRFYASGASAGRSYAPGAAGRASVRRAALRYGRAELRWLWTTGQRRWIPYTIVYELTKFAGLQLGLRRQPRLRPRAR